jgi:hypothetical protein
MRYKKSLVLSFFTHNAHDHTSLEQKPQYSKDLLDLDIIRVVEEKVQFLKIMSSSNLPQMSQDP